MEGYIFLSAKTELMIDGRDSTVLPMLLMEVRPRSTCRLNQVIMALNSREDELAASREAI